MSHQALTALLARNTGTVPVYMSAAHAGQLIERIQIAEPSALRSPSRLGAWLRRKGFLDAEAELDAEVDSEDGERRSLAKVPSFLTSVEAELDHGTVLQDGVAIITVDEALPAKGYTFCGNFVHGYDTLDAAVREALADERVKGIFLRMDSPGGVVHDGINTLTRTIRAADKPIWTHAEMACSAAYWIAAQTDHIAAPTTGLVGSIGAVIVHTEISRMLKGDGVRVEAIESGPHKTGGAMFKALDDDTRAHLKAQVEEAADRFIEAVVEGRPDLDAEAIRALGAQWFTAAHSDPARSGLALGLCDELSNEADAFAALVSHVSGADDVPGNTAAEAATEAGKGKDPTMARKLTAQRRKALEAQAARIQAQLDEDEMEGEGQEPETEDEGDEPNAEGGDEPEAEGDEPDAEGDDEPEAEGDDEDDDATAMRVSHVLAFPEAKGLEATAERFARTPGMSFKQIKAELTQVRRTTNLGARRDHSAPRGGGAGAAGGMSASDRLVAAAKAEAARKA